MGGRGDTGRSTATAERWTNTVAQEDAAYPEIVSTCRGTEDTKKSSAMLCKQGGTAASRRGPSGGKRAGPEQLAITPRIGVSVHQLVCGDRQVKSMQSRKTRRIAGWWPHVKEDWAASANHPARHTKAQWREAKIPQPSRRSGGDGQAIWAACPRSRATDVA